MLRREPGVANDTKSVAHRKGSSSITSQLAESNESALGELGRLLVVFESIDGDGDSND